ncbi:hypothetical protein GQ600_16874 [Phytophthora cactorum]|nr:hypothetical protein GQ600_16874 [Phytophthora cactorum]
MKVDFPDPGCPSTRVSVPGLNTALTWFNTRRCVEPLVNAVATFLTLLQMDGNPDEFTSSDSTTTESSLHRIASLGSSC